MDIKKQRWFTQKAVRQIFAALDNNARFVGGCVRDALLDRQIKDIDIATPFTPEEMLARFKQKRIKAIPTGLEHGTVTAVINKKHYEVTTLRKDTICDGRHAEVEFTDDWEEDAKRRDFTINALYLDADGNIYDYFGGLKDLKEGVVKFIGVPEERIREDYLRILRFFRFSAFYSRKSNLHHRSLQACIKLACHIQKLSGQRIQQEMFKLFTSPDPRDILAIMARHDILGHVINTKTPENITGLEYITEVENEKAFKSFTPDPLFRFTYLLYFSVLGNGKSSGREEIKQILERWRLPNKWRRRIMAALFAKFHINSGISEKEVKKILRHTGKEIFIDITRLAMATELVAKKEKPELLKKKYNKMITLAESWVVPNFPVSGADLLKFGKTPGKEIGQLLKQGEEWWEQEDYKPSKQDVLSYLGFKKA